MNGYMSVAESNVCRLILGLPIISTEAPSAPVVDAAGAASLPGPGGCSPAGAA